MTNSKYPDEMQHNAASHQGLHCLLRSKQSSGTERHHSLENFRLHKSCDPLKYTIHNGHHHTCSNNMYGTIQARIQKSLSEGSDFSFSLMRGGRIQIPLLAGHQRPASGTPLKLRFGGEPIWPNIDCWIGSFVILKGSRPVLLRNPMFL